MLLIHPVGSPELDVLVQHVRMLSSSLDLRTFCQSKGWTLAEDLTDTKTGAGLPVARVEIEGRSFTLRINVPPAQFEAYRVLGDTGFVPSLIQAGDGNPPTWILVEWVEGQSLADTVEQLTNYEQDCDFALDVFQSVSSMYVHPAPEQAKRELAKRAVILAENARRLLQGWWGANSVVRATKLHWDNGVAIHGDFCPQNVLVAGAGAYRLIDPNGGFGPPVRDLAHWMAGLITDPHTLSMTNSVAGLERGTRQLLDDLCERGQIDREGLYAWVAYETLDLALDFYRLSAISESDLQRLIALSARLADEACNPQEPPSARPITGESG